LSFIVAVERGKRAPKITKHRSGGRVDFECRLEKHQCSGGLAAIEPDDAEQVQRVDLIRHQLEHARADLFRFRVPALAVVTDPFHQHLRDCGRARPRVGLGHEHGAF
jgi:hypothetical protein